MSRDPVPPPSAAALRAASGNRLGLRFVPRPRPEEPQPLSTGAPDYSAGPGWTITVICAVGGFGLLAAGSFATSTQGALVCGLLSGLWLFGAILAATR